MPPADPNLPRPPRHLARASKQVWREVVARWELDPGGLMLLRGALECWDTYGRARAELAAAAAVTVTSDTGVTRAHPAHKVAMDALSECRQCWRQLGLEPPEHPDARMGRLRVGQERSNPMTRRSRLRAVPANLRVTPAQLACLRDEWSPPSEPPPRGRRDISAFEYYRWGKGGTLSLHDAWEQVGDSILETWIREKPGTRPAAWWSLDAPEPARRRLGGTGDRLSECLAHGAGLAYGIPSEGWLTRARIALYHGRLAIVLRNRVAGRDAIPVDPDDPPTFEAESVYLARHGLLTPAERKLYDAGGLDTEPELVVLEDDDDEPGRAA